jgi:hypothetical protein
MHATLTSSDRSSCSVCSKYVCDGNSRSHETPAHIADVDIDLRPALTKRPLVIPLAKQGAVAILSRDPGASIRPLCDGQLCLAVRKNNARTGKIWLQCSTRIRWRRGETTMHRGMTRSTVDGLLCMYPSPAASLPAGVPCADIVQLLQEARVHSFCCPNESRLGRCRCRRRQFVWHWHRIQGLEAPPSGVDDEGQHRSGPRWCAAGGRDSTR